MAKKTVELIYRHTAAVRATHWINVACLTLLLMSGLQIFNAHPSLYWGKSSRFDRPILTLAADQSGDGQLRGLTRIGGLSFDTTGILGASRDENGELEERGFPSWITVPSFQDLATGRRWHFTFAWLFVINGLVYLFYSLTSGHVRELVPSVSQLRGIGRSIRDHLRFRFAHGEDARNYNVLQKLAYLGVVVVLMLIVVTGLSMSPGVNAALPWLPELFGGRQSARAIHFLCATATVLFVLVHVFMVLVSGVWNNLRSMITGRYAIELRGDAHE